jgi:hypothetical protein
VELLKSHGYIHQQYQPTLHETTPNSCIFPNKKADPTDRLSL